MTDRVHIKEIFTSIQGEGPFIGYKQLFIRLCGCNLSCKYCDTDYSQNGSEMYKVEDLVKIIKEHSDCHSVSFTGGEPLLNAGFLKELLPQSALPVYLETNATLAGELSEVIDFVDYVSADIKLPSCTGGLSYWKEHDTFFAKASHKIIFAKIVFDRNITEEEITESAKLAAKYGIEIILQPKNSKDSEKPDMEFVQRILDRFLQKYKKVRVIPQIHKILGID